MMISGMKKLLATFLCSLAVLEMVLVSPLVAVACVAHSLENHRKEKSCCGQPTRTDGQTCGCCNAPTTPSPADNHGDRHDEGHQAHDQHRHHDQGLPVLKHAGFGRAVNVTLGLPFIRTSVDHGTALDLAGTDRADAGSLEAALALAIEMAGRRH